MKLKQLIECGAVKGLTEAMYYIDGVDNLEIDLSKAVDVEKVAQSIQDFYTERNGFCAFSVATIYEIANDIATNINELLKDSKQ